MNHNVEIRTEKRSTFAASPKLSHTFDNLFDVVPADTPALLKQVYRLRYQVYCMENDFENPQDHPEGLEADAFDTRSVHTLLLDRSTRTVAGTARLILPDWDSPQASLPIQLVTDRKQPLLRQSAEVSRFAISKQYRKLLETQQDSGNYDLQAQKRMLMPCITLGLIKGIVRMSVEHGITEWYAVMEPALLRLLSRFGIYFKPLGPLVEYHGMRQPCQVNLASLLERVRKDRPDVWDVITDEGRSLVGQDVSIAYC